MQTWSSQTLWSVCQELQEDALLPGLALGMVWNAAGPMAGARGSGEPSLMAPGRVCWPVAFGSVMCDLKEFVTCAVLWEGLFDLLQVMDLAWKWELETLALKCQHPELPLLGASVWNHHRMMGWSGLEGP